MYNHAANELHICTTMLQISYTYAEICRYLVTHMYNHAADVLHTYVEPCCKWSSYTHV